MPAKTTAKGSGMKRKVLGMPVWVWAAAIAGGLIIGVYLRRKSASAAAPATSDTSGQSDASFGAGATPTDNGLGSNTADMQQFLDAQGQLLDQFGSGLQQLLMSTQNGANWGDQGFTDQGGQSIGGDSTGTVTLGLGNTGDLNLSSLNPATLRAAWADYNAAQRRQGITAPRTNVRPSAAGTTQRVPGGSWTQVSGAAVRRVKAIFVPARGGQRAHWALPSGRWVSGPGYY